MKLFSKWLVLLVVGWAVLSFADGSNADAGWRRRAVRRAYVPAVRYYAPPRYVAYRHDVNVVAPGVRVHVGPGVHVDAPGVSVYVPSYGYHGYGHGYGHSGYGHGYTGYGHYGAYSHYGW